MEEQKTLPLSADISAAIDKATSTDEISAILNAQPSEQVAAPIDPSPSPKPAPEVYSDKFIIGGKEVEISGADPADVLRQYKASVQAYTIGRDEAQAKAEPVKVKTAEEIQADKFELESDFRLGKISAKDYIKRSGAVDEILAEQGIDPQGIKALLEKEQGREKVQSWEEATTEFTSNFGKSGSQWPGGPRVLDLMGKTLIELGLSDQPSPSSLQKCYDHLTSKGWDLMRLGQEDAEASRPRETPTPPQKKKAGGSALFNVSGGGGGERDVTKSVNLPRIEDFDSPEVVIQKFKEAAIAQGRNPDEVLRETYGAGRA